ncbi:MAG: pyruvate dehydrogenase complex dihydrolipoamide acetyltransferase [Rhodospirillaceae bacterium]|jgi:pyruvate dehydrogenase E2 component (dihydrolipoamide acetyltransferase)|nr:pyruvate dehydrogenase complex dihydrolipoamide acetyltransferase [Rhodospirillaceae bacterium]MBT5895777.1 pyruvate dehydrogenase complex dihydrolipoamide acetyltransferase [Rhodospirillaceae bacterium]
MPVKILMPALSPTMTEGNLATWHKKEGDSIASGDVLAEIETDKATMEVEAVEEGTLGKILVPDGTESVQVNTVIGLILEDGEDSASLEGAEASPPPPSAAPAPEPAATIAPAAPAITSGDVSATPLAKRMAAQAGLEIASIPGTGARGKITRADVELAMGGSNGVAPASAAAPVAAATGDRIFVSPLARRMAAEAGIDLAAIAGTGPGGRIVKADVTKAQASPPAAAAAAPAPAGSAPAEAAIGDDYEILPMSTMRKVVAERMVHSKSNVPHFYLTVDCEIDELLKVRSHLNERLEDGKLSVNDFVIRACAMALMEVPEANAGWEGEGQMRRYNTANISIAVALDEGLITPIIRHAEQKGLAQISADMKDLATRAKDGKLMPEEYQGGSFSISNLGMFGIKQFDAVINEPQGAILAVGAGEPRPVVKNGELAVATVMSCTLSCDHRVVDGATGAKLLSAIKRLIEYPPAMLL